MDIHAEFSCLQRHQLPKMKTKHKSTFTLTAIGAVNWSFLGTACAMLVRGRKVLDPPAGRAGLKFRIL
ncbi:hypothetical protein EF405_18800 [Cyclobacteriaceae bacterium YHN15]|nr:hypothetical protein EF405_18800 [Cyclobacteriaceae bacterium YHN15]